MTIQAVVPQTQPNVSILPTPGSLFGASHNSPEMPRLSPHITLNASPHGGLPKAHGEKPISGLALSNQQNILQNIMPSPLIPNIVKSEFIQEKVTSSTEPPYFNEDKRHFDPSGMFTSQERVVLMCNQDLSKCDGDEMGKPFNYTSFSENVENFHDPDIGGVAIALPHQSVLFEYAKHELHATTALKNPDRADPKRLSLIFYHHKTLIYRNHGWTEFEQKMERKKQEVEKLAKEGKVKPPAKKPKKNTKGGNADAKKDNKIELDSGPQNGLKRIKFDMDSLDGHPPGMTIDHKKGHSIGNKPATIYPPSCNPVTGIPQHPDLISPPISYANYSHSLPSFVDSNRPFSPSIQRNPSMTLAFSIPSKSPHLITSQSPTLDQHSQKPVPTPDHNYGSNSHITHGPGSNVPPFNTSLQEFNPYTTPGSSPYHNHFPPYMDMQGNPNFSSYQSGNFFSKGPAIPMNYNTSTYVPQPFYGLTPPYSPGPQQPQQVSHHPHHLQSQLPPPGSYQHGIPPNTPSTGPLMNPYEDSIGRGPPTQSTSTWSQMRHVPSFHVHGPYAPWPGS